MVASAILILDGVPVRKTCAKCKEGREVAGFSLDSRKRDGRGSYCRDCHNEVQREWWRRERGLPHGARLRVITGVRQTIKAQAAIPPGARPFTREELNRREGMAGTSATGH